MRLRNAFALRANPLRLIYETRAEPYSGMVIRLKLRELMEKRAALGDRVSIDEIAAATGIGRATLFRMLQQPTYNTTTERLDLLCGYFRCEVQDIAEVDRTSRTRTKS